MPRILVIPSAGAAGRRLLSETVRDLEGKGYPLCGAAEGGAWPDILAAGRTRGLFEEKRAVVVEDADQLGIFPPELAPFVEGEDAMEALLLMLEGDPKKTFPSEVLKKIVLIKAEAVPFWPSARRGWLMEVARRKGIALSTAGAALLVEILEDPEEIRSELEKLGACASGGVVDEEMVLALSFDDGRNRMLAFLDAFCRDSAEDVVSCMEHLRKESSVLPLLTALYNRLRPAVYLGIFPGGDMESVQKSLEIRDYPMKMAREALRHYSEKALQALFLQLLAISWKEKTSFPEGWPAFETALLECLASSRGET